MIHIIVFMVTIHQGAHFCNGCSSLVPDIDISLDAVAPFDPISNLDHAVIETMGALNDPFGRRGLNSELKNVSTCRIEDFEGLRELSHRVDSIQARTDQGIYQHAERKRSGILTNKNMCHPEGEKFECYNDSNKNHCVCHLEQPLDHNNSNISDNPSLTEMGEERNWKQTFLARCFNSNNK